MRPHDLSIVITRPQHQNHVLEEKCRALGIHITCYPCIEITPLASEVVRAQLKYELDRFDLICFTSPNAVRHGLNSLPQLKTLPAHTRIAAVGQSSAQRLYEQGLSDILTPTTTTDTEGLLATLEQHALTHKKVLIIKGVGGRELLKQALENTHCEVSTCDVYERILPPTLTTLPQHVDAILFTSSESAENFVHLNNSDEGHRLFNCQTIVGHPKISDKVTALGFKKTPIIAASPTDEDMYQALLDWLETST